MGVPDTRGVPDPPQEAIDAGAVSLARAVAFIDGDAEDFTVEAMRPLAEDWKWHVSRVLYELRESGAIRYASEVQALEERLADAETDNALLVDRMRRMEESLRWVADAPRREGQPHEGQRRIITKDLIAAPLPEDEIPDAARVDWRIVEFRGQWVSLGDEPRGSRSREVSE